MKLDKCRLLKGDKPQSLFGECDGYDNHKYSSLYRRRILAVACHARRIYAGKLRFGHATIIHEKNTSSKARLNDDQYNWSCHSASQASFDQSILLYLDNNTKRKYLISRNRTCVVLRITRYTALHGQSWVISYRPSWCQRILWGCQCFVNFHFNLKNYWKTSN